MPEAPRPNPAPTMDQVILRTRSAIRKVDRWGERGITMVTAEEVEAMALMLVGLGFPTYPEQIAPKEESFHEQA